MWRLLILILLATSAQAATVTVEKRGIGTGSVIGSIICASGQNYCSGTFDTGSTLSFGFQSDQSKAELLGWGGICGQYEDQPTCTFTIDTETARRFGGSYPVLLGLGYTTDGVCRAGLVGPLAYMYFRSLTEAFTAVKGAIAYNPVECMAGPYLTIGNIDGSITLNGGFPSFTPNTFPAPGSLSTIAGELVVTTGTMVISGDGGVQIACGYSTVTGPYVVTETLVIGATSCDWGLIVK